MAMSFSLKIPKASKKSPTKQQGGIGRIRRFDRTYISKFRWGEKGASKGLPCPTGIGIIIIQLLVVIKI